MDSSQPALAREVKHLREKVKTLRYINSCFLKLLLVRNEIDAFCRVPLQRRIWIALDPRQRWPGLPGQAKNPCLTHPTATVVNWKMLIEREMQHYDETLDDIELSTLSTEDMNKDFYCDKWCVHKMNYAIWTAKRVYFPLADSKYEPWVGSVARNPDGCPARARGE